MIVNLPLMTETIPQEPTIASTVYPFVYAAVLVSDSRALFPLLS
jgi:hypothetical protein